MHVFRECLSAVRVLLSPFGSNGVTWDLMVLVPKKDDLIFFILIFFPL